MQTQSQVHETLLSQPSAIHSIHANDNFPPLVANDNSPHPHPGWGFLRLLVTYDSAGNLTRFSPPDSAYLTYGYDNAHRLNLITNRLNETQSITYNPAGGVTQTQWKNTSAVLKRQHNATFDALNRMVTDVGGMGQTTQYTYDKNGNTLTVTTPLGYVTTNTYDQLDRLKTSKNPLLDTSTITYDSHNRISTVKDYKGNATAYTYNGFGNTIQQVSPDSGTTTYFYDPDSNLTDMVQAGINFSSATYDALDRIRTRSYPLDATINEAYYYDQSGHGYGIGQLTSVIDAAGQLSQSFDERGLLTSSVRTISSGAYTTGYTYTNGGRPSTITYASSGWVMTYSRNNAATITGVTATQPGHGAVNIATSISHLPFGPMYAATYGNGVTDLRTFDLDYRPLTVRDTGTSGDIQYLSYGYDADDNVTSVIDFVSSTNNQAINYDTLDRITYASSGGYTIISSITYDSNSNRKSYSGSNTVVSATSNQMTKFASSNITYTSAGNMNAFGASQTMTYNQANKMVAATAFGANNTYTYDGFGRRILVKASTNPLFVQQYDQGYNLLEETPFNLVNDYVYVDNVAVAVIKTATPTISYIQTDRNGVPQRATSATQTFVWSGNPNPFGQVTPTIATVTMNNRGQGLYADTTPYQYNNNRYTYPSGYGGNLQTDPIGLGGGLNTYIVGNQNPLKNLDPWGLQTVYVPSGAPIIIPPVAIPGTPENQQFVQSTQQVLNNYAGPLAIAALTGGPLQSLSNTDDTGKNCPPGEASQIHGNSNMSPRATEVYYLINRSTGDIDKIGITSNPQARYSQAYLDAENVTYEPQTQYQSRYPAAVDENIRLVHYYLQNGQLPRLNMVTH